MPTIGWLRKEFHYGYDSGEILSLFPDKRRKHEEQLIGGSYRKAFIKGARPYFKKDSKILEIGPGKGSWSRAFLRYLPEGELHTVDFQDVSVWLKPEMYEGRLSCFQVNNFDYSFLPNNYYDFCWSVGVLCHHNVEDIERVLKETYPKMKPEAYAVHHYGNWKKLDTHGWTVEKSNIPPDFKNKPDDEIWWPRNDTTTMASIAKRIGWVVIRPDLNLFKRDSVILLRK